MNDINLAKYAENGDGFGVSSQAEVEALLKSLNAGAVTGRDTDGSLTDSGAPLKLESLEGTLKSITYDEQTIRFWKRVPKMEAYNTVEEYLRFVSPGADRGGFVGETELPEEEDSVYQRSSALVKFMGVTKSVSLAMEMVNTVKGVGNIIQNETRNGSLWILRKVDKSLAFADSDINSYEFDGFYKQQRDAFTSLDLWQDSVVVIDKKGYRLTEADMELASLGLHQNYGYGNLLMGPPVVLSNFVKEFHDKKYITPNTTQVTGATMGQKVNQFASQHGVIDLDDDLFLARNPSRLTTDAATTTKAPATPVIGGSPATAVADAAGGRFLTADAGDYLYAVAAKNRYGESALLSLTAALVSVGATQSVDLQFTSGGGAYPGTGYVIYRSKKDVATSVATTPMYPIFEVSNAELAAGYDGGAAGLVRDRNRYIAGTEDAFLVQNDTQVWSFKQLAPLMKLNLALLSQARRFMVLLYGTPILYAPKKFVRFVNVGTASA